MKRPLVRISESGSVFSNKTYFNIHDTYKLDNAVRDSLKPDIQDRYDSNLTIILLEKTSLIIKNINFRGKFHSSHLTESLATKMSAKHLITTFNSDFTFVHMFNCDIHLYVKVLASK